MPQKLPAKTTPKNPFGKAATGPLSAQRETLGVTPPPEKNSAERGFISQWTAAEQALVADATIHLLEADPLLLRHPAVMLAQAQVLPPDRQRPRIAEWGHVKKWLILPPHLAAQFDKSGWRTPPATGATPPQKVITTNRTDGHKKVFWKVPEQTILARGVALALHQGETTSRVEALRLAELQLPEDRRRNLNSVHSLPWFEPAVDHALKEVRAAQARLDRAVAREANAAQEAREAQHAAQEAQAREATALPPVAAPPAPPPTTAPVTPLPLALHGFEGLRSALVDALAGIFGEALVQAVQALAPPGGAPGTVAAPAHPSPDPLRAPTDNPPHTTNGHRHNPFGAIEFRDDDKPRKRVVIAGLRAAESQLITAEFGDKLDLRYYNTDKSKTELQQMLGACDVALAITDGRISRNHVDIIKARASDRYMPVVGGMMHVRDSLRTVISGHKLVPTLAPIPAPAPH